MLLFEGQLTITLGETAARGAAELLAPAIKLAAESWAGPSDERWRPPFRGSQDATSGGETAPDGAGLLINSREAARLLKVSPRTLWQMWSDGEMPPPIRISRAVRW